MFWLKSFTNQFLILHCMKRLLFFALTLITTGAFSQPAFENRKGGYKISIPYKWTVEKDEDVTSVYVPDEGDMDTWKEKLEVSLYDANDLNLDEAFAFYIEQDLPAMYNAMKVEKQGEEIIHGQKTKWALFSFSQSSAVLYNIFYLTVKGNKIYMLQAVAEKSFYPKYESGFLEIIHSFELTK